MDPNLSILDEELTAAIGCRPGERSGECAGYRHGAQVREVITERGPTPLQIPRGQLALWERRRTTRALDDMLGIAVVFAVLPQARIAIIGDGEGTDYSCISGLIEGAPGSG